MGAQPPYPQWEWRMKGNRQPRGSPNAGKQDSRASLSHGAFAPYPDTGKQNNKKELLALRRNKGCARPRAFLSNGGLPLRGQSQRGKSQGRFLTWGHSQSQPKRAMANMGFHPIPHDLENRAFPYIMGLRRTGQAPLLTMATREEPRVKAERQGPLLAMGALPKVSLSENKCSFMTRPAHALFFASPSYHHQ